MEYAGGGVYEGAWAAGRRHGPGRLAHGRGGGVFVGGFVRDVRQGLGVLYLPQQGARARARSSRPPPLACAAHRGRAGSPSEPRTRPDVRRRTTYT